MPPSIPARRRHLYLVPPLHHGPDPLAAPWPPPSALLAGPGLDRLAPRGLAGEFCVGLPALRAQVPLLRAAVGYSVPGMAADDV